MSATSERFDILFSEIVLSDNGPGFANYKNMDSDY